MAHLLQVRDIAAAEIHHAGGEHHAREHGKQTGNTCNTCVKSAEYVIKIKLLSILNREPAFEECAKKKQADFVVFRSFVSKRKDILHVGCNYISMDKSVISFPIGYYQSKSSTRHSSARHNCKLIIDYVYC